METAIHVEHLHKGYGTVQAVADVSFDINRGEIFGIIGPNGAGKTTTVECLIGLRKPDQGHIRVLGLDPQRQGRQLRQRIGVQLQEAALPDQIKVWETLDLFASFYPHPVDWQALIKQWGLNARRDAFFSDLSGGQKQRLFITLALVNRPEVVFLDELTSGLDPQSRRATWELVRTIRENGTTVVLVTHFMDEAQILCDRLAVIDHGKVVASGDPQGLIQELSIATDRAAEKLSLEDVFLSLTGSAIRE